MVNKTGFPDCPVNPKTGSYFPNNTVPVDPNAAALLTLMPAANAPNSYYDAAPAQPTHWREELVRIDHNFSDNFRIFGHFIHDSWNTVTPDSALGQRRVFPDHTNGVQRPWRQAVLPWRPTFRPRC